MVLIYSLRNKKQNLSFLLKSSKKVLKRFGGHFKKASRAKKRLRVVG
jgi:hypothetical protein